MAQPATAEGVQKISAASAMGCYGYPEVLVCLSALFICTADLILRICGSVRVDSIGSEECHSDVVQLAL